MDFAMKVFIWIAWIVVILSIYAVIVVSKNPSKHGMNRMQIIFSCYMLLMIIVLNLGLTFYAYGDTFIPS